MRRNPLVAALIVLLCLFGAAVTKWVTDHTATPPDASTQSSQTAQPAQARPDPEVQRSQLLAASVPLVKQHLFAIRKGGFDAALKYE